MNTKSQLRRIAALPLSLLMILIAGFVLVNKIPGDKIQGILSQKNNNSATNILLYKQNYYQLYKSNNLDKPLFYFSWASLAVPDSFNYLPFESQRRQLISLSSATGNPEACYKYIQQLYDINIAENIKSLSSEEKLFFTKTIQQLKYLNDINAINTILKNANEQLPMQINFNVLNAISLNIESKQHYWKNYIPIISFQIENQFHYWLFGNINTKGIFQGYFGKSMLTNADVFTTIKKPFLTTLSFSVFSILLSLIITIPIAIIITVYKTNKAAQFFNNTLLYLNGFPVFLIANLLILAFANPNFLNIFPSSVSTIFTNEETSFFNWLITIIYVLFLPVIAYIFSPTAAFIKILTGSLELQLGEEYIKTARAKGLSEFKVIYKHALRLSIIPLLTIVLYSFPLMLGGTIIIEAMFNINGLGLLCIHSILNHDYPVSIAIFLILGLTSIICFSLLNYLLGKIDTRTISSHHRINTN